MDRIETTKISEVLYEEFMEPSGITIDQLSSDIDVPVSIIQDILSDKDKITEDISLRLGKYFGVSDRYFINMQKDIDSRKEEFH